MTKHTKHQDEESQRAEELPTADTVPHWSKQAERLPALPDDYVRNALSQHEPRAALDALAALHGPDAVTTAVKAMEQDPNYGANARAWLAPKTP